MRQTQAWAGKNLRRNGSGVLILAPASGAGASSSPFLMRLTDRNSPTTMKRRLLLRASFVMLLLGIATTPLRADFPQQRKALDELQAAKKADDPMPLLESAKERITKANKGNKGGDKEDVIDKIDEAIKELKAGNKDKMEQKINAAIANLHQGKDKSKKPK